MSWDPNFDNTAYDNSAYGGSYGQYDQQNFQQQNQFNDQYQQNYGQGQQGMGAAGAQGYSQPPPAQSQSQQQSFYNPNQYNQQYGQQNYNQQNYNQAPSGPPHSGSGGQSGTMPGLSDPSAMMNPMMANMAMQYGQDIVGKGQEELKKNLDKYVSIGQLKYYFAVDNSYVGKKLALLLFPFTHSDWSIKYSQDEPVQPKFDLNAPDLYIPCMAYVTYILVVGYVLGIRQAFSPDLLATTASSALVWLILELGVIYLTLTVMNINTSMCKWDVLSFSCYKYVGMIILLLFGLMFNSTQGYYLALLYVSGALAFFLVRTLKLRIEPEVHGLEHHGKRKLYMILFYAALQPFFIWWMTSYFVPVSLPEMPAGMSGGFPNADPAAADLPNV